MNIRELCSEIAEKEGGKREVCIGDIREIVRIIGDMIADDKTVLELLYAYACQRAKRKKK